MKHDIAVRTLYHKAEELASGLVKEIQSQGSIDGLLIFYQGRSEVIQEVLDAIQKLRKT